MANLWTPWCLLFALWACAWLPTSHCRHVNYTFTLTWEVGAPNGNAREMIKINGNFPGPNIIADEGDIIEVTVNNYMPFNTTIHWHGIEQRGSPWSDGVPGLSQRPIEPGESYKYKWHANTYGTYWYHAHSRGTLQDGLYGGIYIHPKEDEPTPFHLISKDEKDIRAITKASRNPTLVLVSDWTNFTSAEYMDVTRKSGMTIFCADSILTNGKGSVFCPPQAFLDKMLFPPLIGEFLPNDKGCFPPVENVQAGHPFDASLVPWGLQEGCVESKGDREVFYVDPEQQWVSFNFIAGTAVKSLKISIDEHPMWVYEVDGRWIEPQLADAMVMYNGERYSVMVKLDKKPGVYTMRIGGSGEDQVISGYATMTYHNSPIEGLGRESIPYINYGGQVISESVRELDVTKLTPFNHVPPALPVEGDDIHFLNVGRLPGSAWKWSMDGKKLYAPDRSAYHPLIYNPNSLDAQDPDLVIRTKNGSWVDIVVQVGTNPLQPVQAPHSVHKHGNKMYKIGKGLGFFNWTSMAEAVADKPELFNLKNPPYRDTFMTTAEGIMWIAIRYQVIIPGPFLLHCHIETHLEGGMAVVLLDGVDKWPEVPAPYRRQDKYGPTYTNQTYELK